MSFKYVALMLDHGPSDAASKLLMMALADRSDVSGVCWPSRVDLMARTGLTNSMISRRLIVLERAGWLQRSARFQASTVFRLNVARLLAAEAAAVAVRRSDVPSGFVPFPEEVSAQAIDIPKDAHGAHKDAHGAHKDAHGAQQTYQEPIIQLSANASLVSGKFFSEYLNARFAGEDAAAWAARVYPGRPDVLLPVVGQKMLRKAA